MRHHIDWLTFTMTMAYTVEDNYDYAGAVGNAFIQTFGRDVVSAVFGGEWAKKERSRAPYTDAWQNAEGGISLFASPNLTHCCVEISGQGCETIIELGKMEAVLERIADRVTRIDIATDIETAVAPTEFVALTAHERMRASGYQKSETGETCYVGSQKSDRYARVYRYSEPHPRSNLLRIEHVFRRDYAKVVAKTAMGGDIAAVAMAAGQAFGWTHPEWNLDAETEVDISVVKAERGAGKTVFWLVHSVAPAFQRLIADGTIRDPERFIREYFLPADL